MKKNKIDKVRAIDLYVKERSAVSDMFIAVLYYDVRKLRRLSDEDLAEILFEKTLVLYPFAAIDKNIFRRDSGRTAFIYISIPLHPNLRFRKENSYAVTKNNT